MSQITQEDIKKISRLSRIGIKESEIDDLAKGLTNITGWVESLSEVNTNGVEIMSNVHDEALRLNKDEISQGDIAKDVLKNTKHEKYDYFTVPKVIE